MSKNHRKVIILYERLANIKTLTAPHSTKFTRRLTKKYERRTEQQNLN